MASSREVAGLLLRYAMLDSGSEFEVVTPGGTEASEEADLLFTEAGFEGREDRRVMELGDGRDEIGGLHSFATTAYLAT